MENSNTNNQRAMQGGENAEIAVLKTQMQTLSTDMADLKQSVGSVSEKMNTLLLNWEGAKSAYVSAEAHNAALQAVRAEMTQQLDKHTKEHTQQLVELQKEVQKLNGVYLKLVGAGFVLTFLLTQFKNIVSFFQ